MAKLTEEMDCQQKRGITIIALDGDVNGFEMGSIIVMVDNQLWSTLMRAVRAICRNGMSMVTSTEKEIYLHSSSMKQRNGMSMATSTEKEIYLQSISME